MAHPHRTEVDVVALVAFVCPADYNLLHPRGIRELCLKDNRLVIFFVYTIFFISTL
jgi:hypothetical protein